MNLLLVLFLVICSNILEIESSNEEIYILSNHTIPLHYNLSIMASYEKFNGEVSINIRVFEKRQTIILHSNEETILDNNIVLEGFNKKINIESFDYNPKNEFLTLKFSEEFNPGDYILRLKYIGRNRINGLRAAYHQLENKEMEFYWATHFEPVFARRVLPCFDEPNFKATFQLQISHLNVYEAVSNTEVESKQINGEITTTIFKKTPKMSTYILAFEISKFKARERISNDFNKKYAIYTKPNLLNSTDFALNLTKSSVDVFEKILGVDYGLPKLDGVFIPEFPGGMENWGLIVYGNYIYNNETESDKQLAINLVCHEVAHQWFGNLVTCNWWDSIWLNEGFATHYALICAEAIYGNNSTRRFMIDHIIKLNELFFEDSIEYAAPINKHVEIPQLILYEKFDKITYVKGSTIVRFMSTFFENFNSTITKYLKKYSYSNVKSEDLFNSFNENSNLPVKPKDIMRNWVETAGYPLITLNVTRNKNGLKIEIKQERFLLSKNSTDNQKWWIPITLAFESESNFDNTTIIKWMSDTDEKITIEIEGKSEDWIIANLQRTVFCRVNYDLDNWKRIINFLKGPNFKKIHVINRAQLLDDANNLAKAGKLPENIVLDLLSYLKQETDPLVLESAKSISTQYTELLKKSKIFTKFKSFINSIFHKKTAVIDSLHEKSSILKLVTNALNSLVNRHEPVTNSFNRLTETIFSKIDLNKFEKIVKKLSKTSDPEYIKELMAKLTKRFKLNETIKYNFINGANLQQVVKWFKK